MLNGRQYSQNRHLWKSGLLSWKLYSGNTIMPTLNPACKALVQTRLVGINRTVNPVGKMGMMELAEKLHRISMSADWSSSRFARAAVKSSGKPVQGKELPLG